MDAKLECVVGVEGAVDMMDHRRGQWLVMGI